MDVEKASGQYPAVTPTKLVPVQPAGSSTFQQQLEQQEQPPSTAFRQEVAEDKSETSSEDSNWPQSSSSRGGGKTAKKPREPRNCFKRMFTRMYDDVGAVFELL